MGRCRTCRHSFPITTSDAKQALVAGVMGTDNLSLLESPAFASLRTVTEWRGCKARNGLVPATDGCGYYSSRWVSLFASEAKDRELYARIQGEIATQREVEIALARKATEEAERDIRTRPCVSCGLLHARCLSCSMPWPYCGKCVRCGGGVRFVRAMGAWECSLCESPAEEPKARQEWLEGRCDSCRELARTNADGAGQYPSP